MNKPIYLDNNATTKLDPRVFEKMRPYFEEEFGNPASHSHCYGWEAELAVKNARHEVAKLLNANKKHIFWTSGATESNNIAILGLIKNLIYTKKTKPHIITSAIEHKAVLDVVKYCENLGAEVSVAPVNEYGQVEIATLDKLKKDNTAFVSIMAANNEIGTCNDLQAIGNWCKQHDIIFHTDAAQATGKIRLNVETMNIDLLSLSGHKMYGPKGVGALFANLEHPNIKLSPLMFGGGQEGGLRPGTLNVPGIVGLGEASRIAVLHFDEENEKNCSLRDHLINEIINNVPQAKLNGHPTERLSNNINFSFKDLSADLFALGLSGLAVSSGSACSSKSSGASYVLKAIGVEDKLAKASLRIGLGRFTKKEDIDLCCKKIKGLFK